MIAPSVQGPSTQTSFSSSHLVLPTTSAQSSSVSQGTSTTASATQMSFSSSHLGLPSTSAQSSSEEQTTGGSTQMPFSSSHLVLPSTSAHSSSVSHLTPSTTQDCVISTMHVSATQTSVSAAFIPSPQFMVKFGSTASPSHCSPSSIVPLPQFAGTVHPEVLNLQSAVQVKVPVEPDMRLSQVTPSGIVPSHSSLASTTPLPQTLAGASPVQLPLVKRQLSEHSGRPETHLVEASK